MGTVQELQHHHQTSMKSFVPLSLLLVGMAKGQDQNVDAASLNEILPEGFTKVCVDPEVSEPKSLSKRQVETGQDAPPCWTLVNKNFDRSDCSSFENTCSTTKPYVGVGENTMCTFFPKASKWFKLSGTYGWCGADNCCDFHPKGQCNPPRPLATFFRIPAGYNTCAEVPDKGDIAVVGSELMKGTEGGNADICIKDQDGNWALEPVEFEDCGGNECCRFKFSNQQE